MMRMQTICLLVVATSFLLLPAVRSQDVAALTAMVQKQATTIDELKAKLDAQETKIEDQTILLNNLRSTVVLQSTTVGQQQTTLEQVTNAQQTLTSQLSNRGTAVGFKVDYGTRPYGDVVVNSGESLKFNRVVENTGDAYNNATGIFTVPISGLYTFHLHFMGGSHNDTSNLGIFAGTRELATAVAEGSLRDTDDQGACTAVAHLGQGQQVSVKLHFGNPDIWGSFVTSFSGLLVFAD